jgi:hypothetical protein
VDRVESVERRSVTVWMLIQQGTMRQRPRRERMYIS